MWKFAKKLTLINYGKHDGFLPEVPKKLPEGMNKVYFLKLVQTNKVLEHAFVQLFVTPDHYPYLFLGEPLLVEEEVGDGFRCHLDKASLLKKLQSLVWVKIEPLDRLE